MKEPASQTWQNGDLFHREPNRVYSGELGWAANKQSALMAHVCYEAAHLNVDEQGNKRGHGKDYAKWICSEEPGTQEGLFSTAMELMIDARLEPNAAVGLHWHHETEEVYYLLEGELTMTTVNAEGHEQTALLRAGDAHFVKLGQGHYGVAGAEGARFVAVAVRRAAA